MDKFSLSPIHNWLWTELDNMGIDSVIYTRHILDLFVSSKYSTDYYLSKKEKSIFDLIIPTSRKRKHKYSKRSNSFSHSEEIAWKKQIAISCLKSAIDSTSNINTMKSIQRLVDEIYTKLTDLRLTPDYLEDEKSQLKQDNDKENYDQAFPVLNNVPTLKSTTSDTKNVWIQSKCKTVLDRKSPTENDPDKLMSKSITVNPKKNFSPKKKSYPGYSSGRNANAQLKSDHNLVTKESFSKSSRQFPYRYSKINRKGFQSNGYKNRNNKFISTNKEYNEKRFKHNTEETKQKKKIDRKRNIHGNSTGSFDFRKRKFNVFHKDPEWFKEDNNFVQTKFDVRSIKKTDDHNKVGCFIEKNPVFPPISSKWFRDPETGLLTFEPASVQNQRPSSSVNLFDDDFFNDRNESSNIHSSPQEPTTAESWMWCPSPSFWVENTDTDKEKLTTLSRFHSIYKHQDEKDKTNHDDMLSLKIWEEYKGIFLDLSSQELEVNSSNEIPFPEIMHKQESCDTNSEFLDTNSDFWIMNVNNQHPEGIYSAFDPLFSENPSKSRMIKLFANGCTESSTDESELKHNVKNEKENPQPIVDHKFGNEKKLWPQSLLESNLEFWINPLMFDGVKSISDDFNSYLFSEWLCTSTSSKPLVDYGDDWILENFCSYELLSLGCDISDFQSLFHPPLIKPIKSSSDNSFAEAITHNEAWKTSLRIANIWQSISGIRPVDIVYSDKMKTLKNHSLIPSDLTHFKPIRSENSKESNSWTHIHCNSSTLQKIYGNENDKKVSNCDMPSAMLKKKWTENGQIQTDNTYDPGENIQENFKPGYDTMSKDICLQTTFEKCLQDLHQNNLTSR